jgi:hypothetical protein
MSTKHNPISPGLEVGFLSSGGDLTHESSVDLTPSHTEFTLVGQGKATP